MPEILEPVTARVDAGPPPRPHARRVRIPRSTAGALATLVLLVAGNALFTPNFATADNAWNILLQVSPTLLVSVAMTFVIATGGIDLSVGAVMALASAIAATQLGSGIAVAATTAVLGCAAIGAVNGAVIAGLRIQPIVVTLATLIAGRGLAQVIARNGQLVPIDDPAFLALGRGSIGPVPVQVLLTGVIVVAAIFALRKMSFGRRVVAIGGNASAARLAGIRVGRTLVLVYVLAAVLSALAGMIEAARLGASDAAKIGWTIELDAIAAVVVGGTSLTGGRASVFGTVIGALIMQVIGTSFNMLLIPYAWSLVLKAVIIVFAVYVQRPRLA